MLKGLKKLDAICARLQTSVHQTDVTDSAQKEASKEENGNKVTIDNALKNESKCNDGGGSSRRKSRKNTNPRNIQSLSMVSETDFEKDELSEYEINNRDVDFGPLLQNGVDVEAAVPTDLTLNDSPKENIPNLNNYANQLTKTADQQNAQDSLKQKAVEKYDALNLSKMATEQKPCDTTPNIPDAPRKECVNSADAATLKDYAQDTVNELLSIYGLGNEAEGITESVPLQNFSSRKILERTTPEPKKRGGHHRSSNNYKKFVDSLSRPQLPEGSVIASPPLQLPGNGNSPAEATPGGMPLSLNLTPKSGKKHKYSLSPEKRKGSPGSYSSPGKDDNLPDYAKYLKRFPNHTECGGNHCSDMNYREHYHCLDCSYRVFVKKEEMVRHYKWHKKRDESLQHGFMRYSPLDDCTVKFGSCTHYGKQTHYHCLQSGCDKVYISTSDVQMHANYHRKASAIIQEGFQRFRATEDCGTPLCQFYGQRTTHFHCRRTGCKFTFKNKADMEKHKSYHQKDEILSKDGFKKFMKYETCGFGDCKYSKVSNHIHCIRPGCDYVLHSTGQLYSHKRKHERKDFEMAYQEFRQSPIEQTRHIPKHNPEFVKLEDLAMMDMDSTLSPASDSQPSSMSESPVPSSFNENRTLMSFPLQSQVLNLKKIAPKPDSPTLLSAMTSENQLNDSLNLPIPGRRSEDQGETMKSEKQEASSTSDRSKDESWMEYLMRYTANDHCHSRCEYLYKDHYHCRSEGCNQMFRSKEGVREHARLHKVQDEISGYGFKTVEADETCVEVGCRHEEKHYHCSLATCAAVITLSGPFDRLKHFKTHEVPTKLSRHGRTTVAESLKRKRGRPPKYPKDEIPIVPRPTVTMEDIRVSQESNNDVDTSRIFEGFKLYEVGEQCPDMFCSYFARFRHWHCLQPRCHHATDRLDVMNIHRKDFHNFVFIREGFEFFDRNVNCRRQHCHNNKANRHFHCVRPRCDYSFVRHTTMEQHERRHLANANDTDDTSASAYPQVMQSAVPASQMILIPVNGDIDSKGIVKAAGTFFPQNMIGQPPALNTPQPIQIIQTTAGPIAVTIPSLQAPHSVGIVQPSIIQGQQVVTSSQQGVNTPSSNFNVSDSPQSQMVSTGAGILPLTMLLQQKVHMPKQDWLIQLSKMHYNMLQNCGRPFCKLKKRNHYHCSECNQAFTEEAKIRSHINSKHRGRSPGEEGVDSPAAKQIKLEPTSVPSPVMNASSVKLEVEDESFDASGYNGDESLHMSLDSLDSSTSSVVTKSGRKAKKSWKFIETDPSQPKKSRSPRGERADSNIPAGYTRVRFDENCGEDKCSYRQSQTHYHCVRDDCKYGFSDRSRMLPHTLRHERIDKIMGDDFHQFRGNLDCEHEGCEFRKKSSHFHCLKCDFMCCDTNRVIGHRKHHSKMDGYLAQGFKKTAGIQDCGVDNCIHKHKQTHYHCMYGDCNYAVLTPSQMSPHKFKHDLEAKQAQAAKVMV